jgi:sulfatase maturation enzyme AslB (radical SAM superfamily)
MGKMRKFENPLITSDGKERASVVLTGLKTLWINTGSLCNLACENCYIESSPKNDQLSFISTAEIDDIFHEVQDTNIDLEMVGLTGGEPFINPDIVTILYSILSKGYNTLILTNGTHVLSKYRESLLDLNAKYANKLNLRISIDHYQEEVHDRERGEGSFKKTMKQVKWLSQEGFEISIASRSLKNETKIDSLKGHNDMLISHGVEIDIDDKLIIFPEMTRDNNTPEISKECWKALNKKPTELMCASQRMIVKRKGDSKPVVMPCTLLAYDEGFILGDSLESASKRVFLNHPFCSQFCVLGGSNCISL